MDTKKTNPVSKDRIVSLFDMDYCEKHGDLKVSVRRKDIVAAILPVQEYWLPLSNLDLLLPALDVGVFFCYKKPTSGSGNKVSFVSMVGLLKKALAQSLVSYFVFAGEVVSNPAGEPEVLCNNRGVDFIEASVDMELQNLDFYNPDDTVEGRLIPKKHTGVLAVQVTELKCGGLIVGCTFDHRVADAYSANMFLVSWAEMAQSKPISVVPSFRRSLLNPRRPALIDHSIDHLYVPISKINPPPTKPNHKQQHDSLMLSNSDDHLVSRIYYVTGDTICGLQLLGSSSNNNNNNNISTTRPTMLESLCAFLWKMMAKYEIESSSSSRSADTERTCKLGIVVDGRSRLNLMASYFGNVLSIPFAGLKVNELNEKSLCEVADEVHELLRNAVTEKHFLDLIDWVEAHRPDTGVAKVYITGQGFVVSSGLRFPLSKVDFGWGKPAFGSYHFPWGGQTGFVMPMPSPLANGDWVVYMHLLKPHLQFIETHATHVFKPLTFDYLQII